MPTQTPPTPWDHFKKYYLSFDNPHFAFDISHMHFDEKFLADMEPRMQAAYKAMDALEKGSIANPDENRMVGHYWLRNPSFAPTDSVRNEIQTTLAHIHDFAKKVHSGTIQGASGPFKNMLVIGIGGSALGPQFVAQALGHPQTDQLKPYFFDNTDPDGFDTIWAQIEHELGQTLVIAISKSGGTPETRNGMLEAEERYKKNNLSFAQHAVAITSADSKLDKHAGLNHWLSRFPMWDWVGGRTSELSAVGLLPAALQGINIDGLLSGAKKMDTITKNPITQKNPAALMALMWYKATDGVGKKDLVILPYKERLGLFSKYLQQLIMESLGKEKDLQGNIVHQGIAVYGNKGSTDQHAYVQQLREGVNNFFVTFIEVLEDRSAPGLEVEPGITSGDYLQAFLLGTRKALYENDRESLTITVKNVSPESVGALIAFYERTVGFYGNLVNINAYHQPGVEAGKKAAADLLQLQNQITHFLQKHSKENFTLTQLTEALPLAANDPLSTFKILEHLSANPQKQIHCTPNAQFLKNSYSYIA